MCLVAQPSRLRVQAASRRLKEHGARTPRELAGETPTPQRACPLQAIKLTLAFSRTPDSLVPCHVPLFSIYSVPMSRKADSGSSRGFDDIIGVVLLLAALLLLMAQLSFDPHDIRFLKDPPMRPAHNWIGPLGAYIAWWIFLFFGMVAYVLPLLTAVFGAAYLFGFMHDLRERLRWWLLWSLGLLVSLTGLLFLADKGGVLGKLRESIGANSAGGWLGYLIYGESSSYQWGFSLLGPIGATIVYAALCLISLIFLTAFP